MPMALSRGTLLRVTALVLAALLGIASGFGLAVAIRSDSAPVEVDLQGVAMTRARLVAMIGLFDLRSRLMERAFAGDDILLTNPAMHPSVDPLLERSQAVSEIDGPLALEAAVLVSEIERLRGEAPPATTAELFEEISDLSSVMCCGGQTGGIRGVSDSVRLLDLLAYGAGGGGFRIDAVYTGRYVAEGVPDGEGGLAEYLAPDIEAAEVGAWSTDDILTTFYPSGLADERPDLWEELEEIQSSEVAGRLERLMVWAHSGAAAKGEPAPVPVAGAEEDAGALFDAETEWVMGVLDREEAALEQTRDAGQTRRTLVLVASLAGLVITGGVLASELRAFRRGQIESEARRREAHAKMEMVAVVAHEIRTPLTGIHGFVKFLETDWRTVDPAQVDEFLALVSDQADQMTFLIDDLLTARRLATGRLELRTIPVFVSEVAAEVAKTVFRDDAARVMIEADPSTEVLCDPTRLSQILRNLMENARKYGGPTVRVRAETVGGRCRIAVIDNGAGVPPESAARLFVRFDRAGADAERSDGFGLGLAIVKDLAEAMGGNAGYLPAEPSGSNFWIELPEVADSIQAIRAA
jgi:signal transduction histidine kinase